MRDSGRKGHFYLFPDTPDGAIREFSYRRDYRPHASAQRGIHGNDAAGRFVEYVQNGVFSGGEREGLALAVYFCLVEIDGAMGQLDHCFLIFVAIGEEWRSAGEGVLWEETVWSCNPSPPASSPVNTPSGLSRAVRNRIGMSLICRMSFIRENPSLSGRFTSKMARSGRRWQATMALRGTGGGDGRKTVFSKNTFDEVQ